MGYEVYITRKEFHFDEDGPDISFDEWIDFVNKHPEFRLDGFAEVETPEGEMLRMEADGLSVWEGYSKNESSGGNQAWFLYTEGSISVKNADQELLTKMHELAQQLSAKVQGEEGELYDSEGKQLPEEHEELKESDEKPWWKLW